MKFCMNLLLWNSEVTEKELPIIQQLQEMGYDGVELPIFEPGDLRRYKTLGKQLDDMGLVRSTLTILTTEKNPISPDPALRKLGIEAVKAVLDNSAEVGAEILAGPFYSALGELSGNPPTEDEWKWGVESVRTMAEHADKVGVRLAIEPLNRFEGYLLNTLADAARFVREIDHPTCSILYDTFHANIEEKNVADAISKCADAIGHIHLSENDRSTPGAGGIDWPTFFDSLHQADFDGWLVVEAFGRRVPELAAATKIWRKMYETEMQLAADALAFMQAEVKKRWQ